jgi:hypothetical protein
VILRWGPDAQSATDPHSVRIITDGRLVLQRKNKYKLAGVCFHHTGAQDPLDDKLEKSTLHDIIDDDITIEV